MLETVLIFAGVFCIAFVFSPVGMGGGMLFVPVLHYGANWPIDGTLLAVSLILTAVVSYGSGLAHRREGHHDDAVIKSALIGAVPGAIAGVGIVVMLGEQLDPVFKGLSLVMLAWAFIKTQAKLKQQDASEGPDNGPSTEVNHIGLRTGSGIGGLLSSVLAIGAGVIYVPVLQQSASLKARTAIGSSLHIMMVVVPVAVITHLAFLSSSELEGLREQITILFALPFLTYLGARMGAEFGMKYINAHDIMKVFTALVAVVFLRYAWDMFGLIR